MEHQRSSGRGRRDLDQLPPTPQPLTERQIRRMEKDAYDAVVQTFRAQSSVFSWRKSNQLDLLRESLRISDDRYLGLLERFDYDEAIRRIREKMIRQDGEPPIPAQAHPAAAQTVHAVQVQNDDAPFPDGRKRFTPLEIHEMEKEAHEAVVRAFRARSAALTWEQKIQLIHIRYYLELSEEHYNQLLNRLHKETAAQAGRAEPAADPPDEQLLPPGETSAGPVWKDALPKKLKLKSLTQIYDASECIEQWSPRYRSPSEENDGNEDGQNAGDEEDAVDPSDDPDWNP